MIGLPVSPWSETSSAITLNKFRRYLNLTMLCALCLWAVLSLWAVPFYGHGLFPEKVIRHWTTLTQAGFLTGFLFWFMAYGMAHPSFFHRCVGEATPGALGAIRMCVCAILLMSTLWEDVASSALLPREMIRPVGVMNWLYRLPIGFENFVASQIALKIFEAVTIALLFLGVIGWKSRVVVPLGGVCYFVMAGILRQYAWFYHTGLIPLYLMAVLSFTPCGDGWSIDRLMKVLKGKEVPSKDQTAAIYGWSRYACWVALALPYVAAGLSKLRNGGFLWWHADNMRQFLYQDSLNPMQFNFKWAFSFNPAQDFPFSFLGLAGLLGELSFGLVLFFPLARLILPANMALMHIGILLLQNVLFFDLIFLQLIFYNFTKIRKTIGRYWSSIQKPFEVFYDGLCPLCRKTVRFLDRLDLFDRLRFTDFRGVAGKDLENRVGSDVTAADLEKEMYVRAGNRVFKGADGYHRIALMIPFFWPIAPFLFLPGISWVSQKTYGWIAQNRFNLIRCDTACSLPAKEETVLSVSSQPSRFRSFLPPLAISGLIAGLLFIWFCRIEYYPLTALQMYSKPVSGTFHYYKVFSRLESGAVAEVDLENAIWAMADSRYRRVLRMAFEPDKEYIASKFLYACGLAFNRKARPGEKILEFEIQKWRWPVRQNPADPNRGEVVDRFVFKMSQGSDL